MPLKHNLLDGGRLITAQEAKLSHVVATLHLHYTVKATEVHLH